MFPSHDTGKERIVMEYQKVNRQGKYDRLNYRILDKMLKYGQVYEYVYLDKNTIKSKLWRCMYTLKLTLSINNNYIYFVKSIDK